MNEPVPCPCDTGKAYDACCGRFHSGRHAPMAVSLMRSRYAAFALELVDYLLLTWHPSTRPTAITLDPGTVWTSLVIEHTEAGKAWDDHGVVQFAASWRSPAGDGVLRERSQFTMVDGRWYYVGGLH